MDKINIYKISRTGNRGMIVYNVNGGPMIELKFNASESDIDVLKKIGFSATEENSEINTSTLPPSIEEAEETMPPEEKDVPKKESVDKQMIARRELKAKYIEELKAAGIDKSKDPSFSRIEAAWKKHCGK